MGKWLNLRSSRRTLVQAEVADDDASPASAALAAEETRAPPVSDAVSITEGGQVANIDIDGLMAAVRDLGTDKPQRAAYGSDMRPDIETETTPEPAALQPSVLSAAAWAEEDETMQQPEPEFFAQQRSPLTRTGGARPVYHLVRLLVIVVAGGLVGMVIMSLF